MSCVILLLMRNMVSFQKVWCDNSTLTHEALFLIPFLFNSTGANSVDHVHLHILPFSRPVWNEIITNIPATTVNTVESYNDLFEVWKKNIPDTYLLFQDLDQKLYYISDSSYMPSQLFRKCLAPYLGANYWDWRSESYSNNILETISLFKGIIE